MHRNVAFITVVTSLLVPSVAVAGAATPRHANTTPAFCQHLSLAKIAAIVGGKVTLAETSIKGTISACIYTGASGPVSIETQTKLPSSQTRSLSLAESSTRDHFPAGFKITFSSVNGFGPVAFTWHAIIGTPYNGLNDYKGSTGYFVEMAGALRLGDLEKLERLALAA
jgi:hypothetical protein